MAAKRNISVAYHVKIAGQGLPEALGLYYDAGHPFFSPLFVTWTRVRKGE
jgi:hypothetical protein